MIQASTDYSWLTRLSKFLVTIQLNKSFAIRILPEAKWKSVAQRETETVESEAENVLNDM